MEDLDDVFEDEDEDDIVFYLVIYILVLEVVDKWLIVILDSEYLDMLCGMMGKE